MGKYVTIMLDILRQIVSYKDKIVAIPYNICIGCIAGAVVILLVGIFLDCKRYW